MNDLSPSSGPFTQSRRPAPLEVTQEERGISLFRPALMNVEKLHTFCLVRTISSSELIATVYASTRLEGAIEIQFDEANSAPGQIIWHRDNKIRVKFVRSINVEDLLTRLSGSNPERQFRYRSPRLSVQTRASFIVEGTNHQIRVCDISQRGLKAYDCDAGEGCEGILVLPGLQPRMAVTRWKKDGMSGLYFIDPIGFADLGNWVLSIHDLKQPQS